MITNNNNDNNTYMSGSFIHIENNIHSIFKNVNISQSTANSYSVGIYIKQINQTNILKHYNESRVILVQNITNSTYHVYILNCHFYENIGKYNESSQLPGGVLYVEADYNIYINNS